MKLAILFWFYKETKICKNHLEILRKYNPNTPIYGLYGGNPKEDNKYRTILDSYLDDFYTFTGDNNSYWKWCLGDLLILDWYHERGQYLPWDSIVIVQWDMLVLGDVNELFSMVEKDQILLSELRQIKEVENKWLWTSPIRNHKMRQKYIDFLDYVKINFGFDQAPLRCVFIVACLPRIFLEKYSNAEKNELGFIEYRIPIYAQIFKIPFCTEHPFKVNFKTLHAKEQNVNTITIIQHLMKKKRTKIFHPYRNVFPLKKTQVMLLFAVMYKDTIELTKQTIYQLKYRIKKVLSNTVNLLSTRKS